MEVAFEAAHENIYTIRREFVWVSFKGIRIQSMLHLGLAAPAAAAASFPPFVTTQFLAMQINFLLRLSCSSPVTKLDLAASLEQGTTLSPVSLVF